MSVVCCLLCEVCWLLCAVRWSWFVGCCMVLSVVCCVLGVVV